MFGNLRKECFMHFIGMSDISVILSDVSGKARLFVYLGDCTKALTSREYPTAELLVFCETYFKGIYQINGVPKEKAEKAAWQAQPLTDEFFTNNFKDADLGFLRWCTTKEQTPVSIDIYKRRDGIYTVIVFDEVRDNIFNASTIGELVTFLNLCGHNDFVSKLKF